MKPHGKRVDNMIVKFPVAMKCAFGENPKRCYQKNTITSRMTNAALIREALKKASLYKAKVEAAGDDVSKLPAYDQKSEALIPVLNKEIPLKAHAQDVYKRQTSPLRAPFSSTLIPTSATTAPGFTNSPEIIPALPAAATRMSASRHTAFRSAVFV